MTKITKFQFNVHSTRFSLVDLISAGLAKCEPSSSQQGSGYGWSRWANAREISSFQAVDADKSRNKIPAGRIIANSSANRLKFRKKRVDYPQQGSMFTNVRAMIDDEPDWPAPVWAPNSNWEMISWWKQRTPDYKQKSPQFNQFLLGMKFPGQFFT